MAWWYYRSHSEPRDMNDVIIFETFIFSEPHVALAQFFLEGPLFTEKASARQQP